jgi:hypothetical protein
MGLVKVTIGGVVSGCPGVTETTGVGVAVMAGVGVKTGIGEFIGLGIGLAPILPGTVVGD